MSTLTDPIALLEAQASGALTKAEKHSALYALASALRHKDLRRAFAICEEAVCLAREGEAPADLAASLCLLGDCASRMLRHREAKEALEESLLLSRRIGDRRTEAYCLQFLGRRRHLLADYAGAIRDATASFEIGEAAQDWVCVSGSFNLIGVAYYTLCDYEQALHWFTRGLEVRERIGDECGIGSSLSNIGIVYMEMEERTQSLEFCRRSLSYARRLGDLSLESNCLCNLGNDWVRLSRYPEALEASCLAAELAEKLGDSATVSRALANAAQAYAGTGRYAEASGYFARALDLARSLQDTENISGILHCMGASLAKQGELEEAHKRLAEAAALAQSVGARKTAFLAFAALSEVCKRLGQYAAALGHYEMFRRLEKEVFTENADKRAKALVIKMEVEHHRREAEALAGTNAALVASNLALREANACLESLATTDPLTGLPNHRALVAALDAGLSRARRSGEPCALLFLDIDHFKSFNDTYGHPVGDAVLREFAQCVRASLREEDTLGRWGGEEFLALLPGADLAEALHVGERVRAAVAGHPLAAGDGLHMTCSIGASSSAPGEEAGRDAFMEAADQALYAAKRLGRNQVRGSDDPVILTLAEPLFLAAGSRAAHGHCTAVRSQAPSRLPI